MEEKIVLSWDSEEEILRSLKILSIFQRLLTIFYPEVAMSWLHGHNILLGDQRPIDLIRRGELEKVLDALQQEEAGGYA